MKKHMSQIVINLVLAILSCIVVIPFLILVGVSFSSEQSIVEYGYSLIPREVSLDAYRYILENPKSLLNAYKVTAVFSILYMVIGVLLMAMLAYPLSRTRFKHRRWITFYVYFTSMFSGGLVASYILITQYLHLNNTIWVYILPAMVSPWYIFMMRTFFREIPGSIIESVIIDGGNEFTIFAKFILPLSKPVLATVCVFLFFGKWQDWMTPMLYIDDEKLISLQYLLQRIMKNIELLQTMESDNLQLLSEIPSETVRMAMAVLVAGPILLVFPFFQKYFVKGMTVGAVKG